MLVYRLLYAFAIGLVVGGALFLGSMHMPLPRIEITLPASIEQTRPVPTLALHDRRVAEAWPTNPAPTIIDVAPGITAVQLELALRLAADEQIVGIDGVAVTSQLGAGLLLASRDLRSREFLDLQVRGDAGERRVLVLLH
ncbi:MAG TPA: hypothetical protein VIV11_42130 [Kofleriaceae bacterium]